MKILMDFLNLFGINVNINENRGVLRPPPLKGGRVPLCPWLRSTPTHCHNFKFYYS